MDTVIRKMAVTLGLAALLSMNTAILAEMHIGTNFWNVGWGGSDPFKDGNKNVSGENPWDPEFLKEIEKYTVFRFMDFQRTNNLPAGDQGIWTQRVKKTDSHQNPVSFEWMIDLCNIMQKDMWVCAPHAAIDRNGLVGGNNHYIKKMAIIIKTGVDMLDLDLDQPRFSNIGSMNADQLVAAGGRKVCDPLDDNLQVYIEYSNETWNGAFAQADYCWDEGEAKGLDDNRYTAGYLFHAWAAILMFEEFEDVFGRDNPRIVKVDAQQMTSWQTTKHLEVYRDPSLNPSGTFPDAFTVAPYVGHDVNGGASNAVQQIRNTFSERIGKVREIREKIDEAGEQDNRDYLFIAYEGGQHVTTGADDVNSDPGMYDLYIDYLNECNKYFTGVFCHYCHSGRAGGGGAWGSKLYIGQPESEAHKYRALMDWIDTYQEQKPVQALTVSWSGAPSQTLLRTGADGSLHIRSPRAAHVRILDAAGRTLLRKALEANTMITIPTNAFPHGFYATQLQSRDNTTTLHTGGFLK
jgi:hypothetical protein